MPRPWLLLTICAAALLALGGACRAASPTPIASSSTQRETIPPGSPASVASPTTTSPVGSTEATTAQTSPEAVAIPEPSPSPQPSVTPLPAWPARWEPTGGPASAFIAHIAIDPSRSTRLYAAGMGGGIYRSDDGGETWSMGDRLAPPSCPFTGLIVDGGDSNRIYAASACNGLFRSADTGITWSHTGTNLEGAVHLLVQSSHAADLLLAADSNGQIYRSRDGAQTWEQVGAEFPGAHVTALAIAGPDNYWATAGNGQDGALYRFANGAWSAVVFGQPGGTEPTGVLVDLQNAATVYVALRRVSAAADPDGSFLFRSTDGGVNWSPLPPSAVATDAPASFPIQVLGQGQLSGALYAARGNELLASTDSGNTWQSMTRVQAGDSMETIRQLAIDPTDNGVLYLALRAAGIAKSEDGGMSWRAIHTGLNSTIVGIVMPHPANPVQVYSVPVGDPTLYRSNDYGDTWTRLSAVDPGLWGSHRVTDLAINPHVSGSMVQVVDGSRFFQSQDGGSAWSSVWPDFHLSSINRVVVAPSDPLVLYANQSGSGLFRSEDQGLTWRPLHILETDSMAAIAVHPDDPLFLLAGASRGASGRHGQVYRSRDGGASWDVALELADANGVTSLGFDPRVEPFFPRGAPPADPTRLYAASVGPRATIWFSNDGGDTWNPLNDDLSFTNIRTLAVAPHLRGVAYAGVWGAGTWHTQDSGRSWQRVPGDPATSAVAIEIDSSNHNIIYIADGTTPHLYRSIDGGDNWELFFDAGGAYQRMAALALAPSDPTTLYAAAIRTSDDAPGGTVFRVDVQAPAGENVTDITGNLPDYPVSLAIHRRDPRRIFVVLAGGGVWKTVDDGASWRQVKSGLPDIGFFQIAVDPLIAETLYLAGGYRLPPESQDTPGLEPGEMYGVWKSTDDGNSWSAVGAAVFGRSSGPVQSLAFHPDDQRVMYASGEGGVYLSPDRGETWTSISGRLPALPVSAVATDGETLYAGSAGGGVFAGEIHPLIHTADWKQDSSLTVPIAHVQIALHPESPQTLYASAYPGGVYKSTDEGVTWFARNLGLPAFAVADPSRQGYYALAIAPSSSDILYAGLYGEGVFRSDDSAVSWRPVNGDSAELQGAGIQALLVHPENPDIVYTATTHGVWYTNNGGRSWILWDKGLAPGGDVRALALAGAEQLYAGTGGYGVYARASDAEGWQQLPALGVQDPFTSRPETEPFFWRNTTAVGRSASLLFHPSEPETLFASSLRTGIFKTVDGGLTWRERNVGLANDSVLTLVHHPDDGEVLYAGTTDGIARSTNGGAIWYPSASGWPPHQWVTGVAFDPSDPNVMYASARNGDAASDLDGVVMKSTDGGANWFEITLGLEGMQSYIQIGVERFDPTIVYLTTEDDGIYISRDAGASWSSWNEGLWSRVAGGDGNGPINLLQSSADGRLLYFGTAGSGVWRRPAEAAP